MAQNPHRLITIHKVMDRVGLAKSTIYARVQNGSFPNPVRLGSSSRWVEAEIDNWIEEQIEIRDAASGFCAMPANTSGAPSARLK